MWHTYNSTMMHRLFFSIPLPGLRQKCNMVNFKIGPLIHTGFCRNHFYMYPHSEYVILIQQATTRRVKTCQTVCQNMHHEPIRDLVYCHGLAGITVWLFISKGPQLITVVDSWWWHNLLYHWEQLARLTHTTGTYRKIYRIYIYQHW